jgi:hypothetical protein
MPQLLYETLEQVTDDLSLYPIFVETGSLHGQTILGVEKYFEELHTIEIKEQFYNNLVKQYKGNKIRFHLGDSSIVLNKVIKTLNNNAIFFLDGHYSGGDTGKGDIEVPLYEEVQSIVNEFKHKCIIIIDDYRLFGIGPNNDPSTVCNWENISKNSILTIVKDRLTSSFHLPSELGSDDRLVLHLNSC